jgi:replicative DNA helicase
METTLIHNKDLEYQVLSAMMQDISIYDGLFDRLSMDMFFDAQSRITYGIMLDRQRQDKKPDMYEIGMQLNDRGCNISDSMMMDIPLYELTSQRIDILKEYAVKRSLVRLCIKGEQLAKDPMADINDLHTLIDEFQNVASDKTESVVSIGDTIRVLHQEVADRKNGKGDLGMMTGLHLFDVRYGWHTGDLIVIAGSTSQGKSTLATTIARNMALRGIPVAYYSLEMGARQLTARITARDTLVASSRILYKQLDDVEYCKFYDTTLQMMQLPIYYDESNKTSFSKICGSIRSLIRKHTIKVAFIDYLQILVNGQSDSREQMLGDMARELKRLAVDENVCIVLLSQLSRARKGEAPTLNRLRGSGQIEEAADVVVTIHRPELDGVKRYNDGRLTEGTAELTINKGRNIGLGSEVVSFNSELTFFCDYDSNMQQSAIDEQKGDKPW